MFCICFCALVFSLRVVQVESMPTMQKNQNSKNKLFPQSRLAKFDLKAEGNCLINHSIYFKDARIFIRKHIKFLKNIISNLSPKKGTKGHSLQYNILPTENNYEEVNKQLEKQKNFY